MENKLNNCFCFNDTNDNFMKWIIELLGPVILGSKPAEILSFPYEVKNGISKIEYIKNTFDKSNIISYREFSYCNKCTKVLFFNPISLNNTLIEHKNLNFLKKLGYPNLYNLKEYLDYIIEKMKMGHIPDEIGIFLGYPLKDVIGFMGHPSLKLTKINGWRVYGDTRISDEKYRKFINDRKKVKSLLETTKPEHILLQA